MLSIVMNLILFLSVVMGGKGSAKYSVSNYQMPVRERPFVCPDIERVKQIDADYQMCYTDKWIPFQGTRLINDQFSDERQCCHFWDRRCQYDKLTRDVCKITDEKAFTEDVNSLFRHVIDGCQKINVYVSESFCKTLKTNPVYKPYCQKYISCSMKNSTIGGSVNSIPVWTPAAPPLPVWTHRLEAEPGAKTEVDDIPESDTTPGSGANMETPVTSLLIIFVIISYFSLT